MNIYESWDLTPVELPARSRLYSLGPIGLGTADTESLSSYILRLTNEHCLTPRTLIMGEMAPLVLTDFVPVVPLRLRYGLIGQRN